MDLGLARSAGRPAEWPGASWLAASLPWAPWLARFGGPGCFWLALAGSIWPRAARSGCPGRSGWLALDALGAPGSPWLANDCPIDTISKKKSICFSTILLRCCLLRALWYVSSCLKASVIIFLRILFFIRSLPFFWSHGASQRGGSYRPGRRVNF